MLKRTINIDEYLEENKILVIYGARQVGKTTLVKSYLKTTNKIYLFFTGDDLKFAEEFSKCDLNYMQKLLTGIELLVIDEAQKVPNIGRALKLVVDNIPHIIVIVTGSSSFDLVNITAETLTGRKTVLKMYPLSQTELLDLGNQYTVEQMIPDIMRYGSYPEVIKKPTFASKEEKITEIAHSYLLKDILTFNLVKNSRNISNLLKLLAFQIGSEVSLNELANALDIDKKTVARYIDLLEKSFVIFRLTGFSRNLRSEVTKMNKYYFNDLGIRNAIISNFNDLETRNDIGMLWENFLLIERKKYHAYKRTSLNYYFWRTYNQKEIDLIEERGGKLYGYEFKWNPKKKPSPPKDWINTYKNSSYDVINPKNYFSFVS